MKSIFIFFNRIDIKTGIAIIFFSYIAFLISDYLSVTDNDVAIDALISIEHKMDLDISKQQHKIVSTDAKYYATTQQIFEENYLAKNYENEACSDNSSPPENNCTQASGIEDFNAEMTEINALKKILYDQDKVKIRIEAVKKLGKYRNKVSYETLIEVPFDLNSEIRLEIIKQLRNLVPQLIEEFGSDVRYVFELAMSDMDKSISAIASDALDEIDYLNNNSIEKNHINKKTHNNNSPF